MRKTWITGLLLLISSALPGWAGDRVALLIGNAAYRGPGLSLANPVNDVSALASALDRQGFEVAVLNNGTRATMHSAVADAARSAADAEIVLFFYAGHGVQLGGENYLIGVEFSGSDTVSMQESSVRLSDVRTQMAGAGADLTMIVLDACRDTPFSESGETRPGLRRESGGVGQLIAYATDPGNVALDGRGQNSVFTTALLDHLETPGLDVRLMLGRVRQQVVLSTAGRQVPWVEEAVVGEHVISIEPAAPGTDDPLSAELRVWRAASSHSATAGYQDYLAAFPNGLFAELAMERLDEARPSATGTPEAFDLALAEPGALAAALSTLGLLTVTDAEEVSPEALSRSFEIYRQQQPDPGSVLPEDLYREAGRYAAFLAAATAQRLRTDIVALRSVERTLDIAEDALVQIEDLAGDDPTALPVLSQARSDVVAIQQSRLAILERLDVTRGYYAELLETATAYMPDGAALDLLGEAGDSRGAANPAQNTLADARKFIDHVARAQMDQNGSYQWLRTFLPET